MSRFSLLSAALGLLLLAALPAPEPGDGGAPLQGALPGERSCKPSAPVDVVLASVASRSGGVRDLVAVIEARVPASRLDWQLHLPSGVTLLSGPSSGSQVGVVEPVAAAISVVVSPAAYDLATPLVIELSARAAFLGHGAAGQVSDETVEVVARLVLGAPLIDPEPIRFAASPGETSAVVAVPVRHEARTPRALSGTEGR